MARRAWSVLAAGVLLSTRASAAGYDQPLPITARHVGIGGAHVAAVDDASAAAHNPAGLAWVDTAGVVAGVTLMTGRVRATPESDTNVESDRVFAPLPFVSGAVRPLTPLTLGIAARPIAAAGATYQYLGAVGDTVDETRAAFIEVALSAGVALPHGIALGASQRSTFAQLTRHKQGSNASNPGIDMKLSGASFTGFRLGAQWHALEDPPSADATERRRLRLGATYRHRTEIDVSADNGYVLSQPASEVSSTLVLPSRFSAGLRSDFGRFGWVMEVDYVANGQNDRGRVKAQLSGSELAVPALYDWRDAVTLRAGVEVRLLEHGQLALRAGAVRDGASASRAYPSPFGPPPAPTWAVTLGGGVELGAWSVNAAYAHRFGGTTVSASELGKDACAFCGYAGDYSMKLHLIAVDAGYRFDWGADG